MGFKYMNCESSQPEYQKGQIYTAYIIDIAPQSLDLRVQSGEQCASCGISGSCSSNKANIINLPVENTKPYKKGQLIYLKMAEGSTLKGLLVVFLLPIMLLLGMVLLGQALDMSQASSALLGLGLLALYYGFFFIFRKKIQNTFKLSIVDLENQEGTEI